MIDDIGGAGAEEVGFVVVGFLAHGFADAPGEYITDEDKALNRA